ncbi:DUF3429 domain-containing protein [Rhodoferax antarcticus]|uniref:DUF3429 domain-containing protein n=1 Tax=Rhodoferax antarcticus TaxID=81479 RepID=UPI002224B198|nr:DUF3429 domain-containing protein [Rhodoferax antarcticus]MCW2310649.1 hypothetical protein [Rhodoferax antarcticus]
MTSSPTSPTVVAWLGYGGLIPFLALAGASWLDPAHSATWVPGLLAYGAVILSFVGALHWAFAMTHPQLQGVPSHPLYLWSVVPSLLGWAALMLVPKAGAILLIAGLLAHYRQDLRLARMIELPVWYLPLRLRLSVVACLCLTVVFFTAG